MVNEIGNIIHYPLSVIRYLFFRKSFLQLFEIEKANVNVNRRFGKFLDQRRAQIRFSGNVELRNERQKQAEIRVSADVLKISFDLIDFLKNAVDSFLRNLRRNHKRNFDKR